jgi:hypothetical protein
VSITTRRFLRPGAPCRGRIGRLGLLGPDSFAIRGSSVEGGQFGLDLHRLPEGPVEGAP